MKELKSIARYASILAIVIAAACTPEEKPGPEPEPEPGPEPEKQLECQQVYFDNTDLKEINLLEAGKEGTITFKVARVKADAAISVPVTAKFESSLGLSVPSTVEFGATAKEAELVVSYPATLPTKTLLNIDLELTGDHVDPFLSTGSNTAATQIVVPETSVARTRLCDVNYVTKEEYGQWAQEVTVVTEDWIILKNYLKSNIDVTLKACGRDESLSLTHYKVETATAGYAEYYSDYNDYVWYFADADTGEWMQFSPFGEDAWFHIDGTSLLYKLEDGPEDEYDIYKYDGVSTLYATTSESYYDNNGTLEGPVYYDQVVFTWDVDFEEFLPEYKEPEYGDTKVTVYFESDTEYGWDCTGSWDGSSFVIDELFGLKKFNIDLTDGEFSGISCPGIEYDSEYACYYSYNYLSFEDGYKQIYIDYPSSYSYYDAEAKTLYLSTYFFVYDASDAVYGGYYSDYDTLVIKIGE